MATRGGVLSAGSHSRLWHGRESLSLPTGFCDGNALVPDSVAGEFGRVDAFVMPARVAGRGHLTTGTAGGAVRASNSARDRLLLDTCVASLQWVEDEKTQHRG